MQAISIVKRGIESPSDDTQCMKVDKNVVKGNFWVNFLLLRHMKSRTTSRLDLSLKLRSRSQMREKRSSRRWSFVHFHEFVTVRLER